MAEFRPHIETVKQAGVGYVIIGSGTPHFAKSFAERMKVEDVPLYSDTELKSYAAAGMHRGGLAALNPMVLIKGIKSALKYPQKHIYGDVKQLGGVLLVMPDGSVPYKFTSSYAGQHPKNEALVAAALKAVA